MVFLSYLQLISSQEPSDISNLFTTFVTGEGKSIGMRILSALIIIGVIVGIVVLVVILQAATMKYCRSDVTEMYRERDR